MVEKRTAPRRASDRAMLEVARRFISAQQPDGGNTGRKKIYRTPRDVAEMFDCTIQHIYKLIADGELRANNVALARGKTRAAWRIEDSDIQDYLASRRGA